MLNIYTKVVIHLYQDNTVYKILERVVYITVKTWAMARILLNSNYIQIYTNDNERENPMLIQGDNLNFSLNQITIKI